MISLCGYAETLWWVAQETLPSAHTRSQQKLLQKSRAGRLTDKERAELTRLRTVADHFVLRRSTLLALLKWRGYTLPINSTTANPDAVAAKVPAAVRQSAVNK